MHMCKKVNFMAQISRRIFILLLTICLLSGCARRPASEAQADAVSDTEDELILIEAPDIVLADTEESTAVDEEAPPNASDSPGQDASSADLTENAASDVLPEDGTYNSRDEVALYLYTYDHLPDNYMTKKEAQALGWSGGSLEEYAPGMSIGGDYFGNYEGVLPKKKGVSYHECDIGTAGRRSRGAKRIIYSTDGLIYYTDDHYESFTLLYDSDGPADDNTN